MGKHSKQGISYWEARRRRKDLRKREKAKNKPARRGPTRKRWFIVIFLLGLLVGGALGYYHKQILKAGAKLYLSIKQQQWQPEGEEKEEVQESLNAISKNPDESVNTLVMGSDLGSNKGETGWCRSDVMMLVCLHERDKKAVVVSIPRDTKIKLSGYGTQKINAAHSYGGPSAAIDAAKQLTGIDVHHFVSMNFEGFEQIVDAIGGVPIHLNKPINDPHAGYLPAGDLNLTGEQALIIVRSRKLPGGDLDRIKSQQAFLKALVNKAAEMRDVWKAKKLVDIVAGTCQMDYTAGELTTMAEELKDFSITSVQFVTVPGVPKTISGASYFVADETALAELAAEVKANTEISPELMSKLQTPGATGQDRVEQAYGPDADVVTVLSGRSSSATAAVPIVAEELRLLGHQMVFEGTANRAHQNTTMYYRPEAKDNCEGIKNSVPEFAGAELVVDAAVAEQYNSPVVVVLGSEFTTPPLYAIYGRIMKPVFEFDGLGQKVKSLS
jgi:LCP family protein required for cell wall assembly